MTSSRRRILVTDDDEVTRKLLKEVLAKQGYEVALASSGEDALKALGEAASEGGVGTEFGVIVSDIRMFELDGLAVLRAAKRVSPRTSVVLMTGFGSVAGAIDAIRQGAFDYISKPFKIDELRSVVANAWRRYEQSESALGFLAPTPGPAQAGAVSLEEIEKAHILRVLQETGFNKSRASEILGIDRATLYRKAQRHGIELSGARS